MIQVICPENLKNPEIRTYWGFGVRAGHIVLTQTHMNCWPYRCELKIHLESLAAPSLYVHHSCERRGLSAKLPEPKPSPHSTCSCIVTCYQHFRYVREKSQKDKTTGQRWEWPALQECVQSSAKWQTRAQRADQGHGWSSLYFKYSASFFTCVSKIR